MFNTLTFAGRATNPYFGMMRQPAAARKNPTKNTRDCVDWAAQIAAEHIKQKVTLPTLAEMARRIFTDKGLRILPATLGDYRHEWENGGKYLSTVPTDTFHAKSPPLAHTNASQGIPLKRSPSPEPTHMPEEQPISSKSPTGGSPKHATKKVKMEEANPFLDLDWKLSDEKDWTDLS